jgi:creatinine amidohydrolase
VRAADRLLVRLGLPLTFFTALTTFAADPPAPSTREMERINWMEFREWVPGKINTVLLPLGTIEPHGVTANGADILAPVAIAKEIAPRVNAMIAPVIPYGFTGVMDAYPGAFTVPEDVYRPYVRSVLVGLAKNKFKNIILVVTLLVNERRIDRHDERVLVFGSVAAVFSENFQRHISAIRPPVHGENPGPGLPAAVPVDQDMVTANPSPGTWSAYPNPSSITLYKDGQGYPKFDLAKAKTYYAKVNDKLTKLIQETIRKWDLAGL